MEKNSLNSKTLFTASYAAQLMGCGVHTSRVVRNTKRIGEAMGVHPSISVFPKSIILTLLETDSHKSISEVVEVPSLAVSYELNSELSALSWEAVDSRLPFMEIQKKYNKIITTPRMHPLLVLFLVGCANASFCKLFGGSWCAMGAVFLATLAGFFLRTTMLNHHINHYITFIVSAFSASLISLLAFLLHDPTFEIALASSVLYLVPGVPLINGVIDIIEGYTLTGISRLTYAMLLIISIAIGLSFTLILIKDKLI